MHTTLTSIPGIGMCRRQKISWWATRVAAGLVGTGIGLATLTGCVSSQPVQSTGGARAYTVKCGASMMERCYTEAARVCPGGYSLFDKTDLGVAPFVPNGITGGTPVRGPNTMLVKCDG